MTLVLFRRLTVSLALSFGGVSAQEVLREIPEPADSSAFFGVSIEVGPDQNGDGIPDLFVGAPGGRILYGECADGSIEAIEAGKVYALSPTTGEVLGTFDDGDTDSLFGAAVVLAPDRDGGGQADVFVGAPGANSERGRVDLISSETGAVLLTRLGLDAQGFFGTDVVSLDDLNGDGIAEFVVAAPADTEGGGFESGAVYVFDGQSGVLEQPFLGSACNRLGASLAGLADLDGDDKGEFAFGVPRREGVDGEGAVQVISSSTSSLLYLLEAPGVTELGWVVSRVEDVDGDGVEDIVAAGTSHVVWFSGVSGLEVGRRELSRGGDPSEFELVACGDVDRDGRGDVLFGPEPVEVLSGDRVQSLLGLSSGEFDPPHQFGRAIVVLGDTDGNGRVEFVVSEPGGGFLDPSRFIVAEHYWDSRWIVGPSGAERFGGFIANGGDITGDGVNDFIVGESQGYGRELQILDGVDFSTYRVIEAPSEDARFGAAAGTLTDLDGDGHAEYYIAAPEEDVAGSEGLMAQAGVVRFYDGATGSQLSFAAGDHQSANFGRAVGSLGDTNGDGVPELLIGAPGRTIRAGGYPHPSEPDGYVDVVSVSSPSTPTALYRVQGIVGFGSALAGLDDLDGDMVSDFAVGMPYIDEGMFPEESLVEVYSGDAGAFIARHLLNSSDGVQRLIYMDRAGDVDGNGRDDIIVGVNSFVSTFGAGDVCVLDGLTGDEIASFGEISFGYPAPIEFGYAVAGVGDFDGDGNDDFAIGDPPFAGTIGSSAGRVQIFNADGDELASYEGTSGWDYLGYSIVSLDDHDGDGFKDVLIGVPAGGGRSFPGRLRIFSQGPQASVVSRSAGANPNSYSSTELILGRPFESTVDLASSGHSFAAVIGFYSPLELTLGAGQVLLVNPADPSGELLAFTAAAGPIATFSGVVPPDVSLVGRTVFSQAVHLLGVAPFALSNAQDLFIGY